MNSGFASMGGGFLETYGNLKANQEEGRAHRRNAAFYREQSEFARQAMMREYNIYNDQAADYVGEQITQISAGGVDLSGSPLLAMATTFWRQEQERTAILEDGAFKQREATLKAQESDRNANWLNSADVVIPMVVGGYFSMISGGMSAGGSNPSANRQNGISNASSASTRTSRGQENPSSAAKYWSTV